MMPHNPVHHATTPLCAAPTCTFPGRRDRDTCGIEKRQKKISNSSHSGSRSGASSTSPTNSTDAVRFPANLENSRGPSETERLEISRVDESSFTFDLDEFSSLAPNSRHSNVCATVETYENFNTTSDAPVLHLTARTPIMYLRPYVELFFTHLYPIMPVLDPKTYIESYLLCGPDPLSSEDFTLITALSAITIVQTNLSSSYQGRHMPALEAEILIEQYLQERSWNDSYLETPTTMAVITSFFLFGYYGNVEMHGKSRYYLQEAILFAEMISLDDEEVHIGLSDSEIQWRRRLFWLLFITERLEIPHNQFW